LSARRRARPTATSSGGNGGASHDAITFSNGTTIDARDFTFP
jgi:hypothetical protein